VRWCLYQPNPWALWRSAPIRLVEIPTRGFGFLDDRPRLLEIRVVDMDGQFGAEGDASPLSTHGDDARLYPASFRRWRIMSATNSFGAVISNWVISRTRLLGHGAR
jgi:hypothetical protein